jgi:hypothetical protein
MDEVEFFFCQFPNPWALRVSGMGDYTSKCEKSQNHCTLPYSITKIPWRQVSLQIFKIKSHIFHYTYSAYNTQTELYEFSYALHVYVVHTVFMYSYPTLFFYSELR